MDEWLTRLDLSRPCWEDYRPLIRELDGGRFPTPRELSALLPPGLSSHGGKAIRFVPAAEIPGVSYEIHIFEQGQVSTREANWHDLFNALVWSRFPRMKAALNAVHYLRQGDAGSTGRGKVRDALTLLDESGALVVSTDRSRLEALAGHHWERVFGSGFRAGNECWAPDRLNVFLCGHALLEKFLDPYLSMTAHVILVHLDPAAGHGPREAVHSRLDDWLAGQLLRGSICSGTGDLSPLPLMGIPCWWAGGAQDESFYSNRRVFRPLREGARPAPVFDMSLDPGHGRFPAPDAQ
jgi:hypothetical protein